MPALSDPQLFTTGRIARICRVAPRTVSNWIDSGRLKGYRLPGSKDRRVTAADLVPFLREHNMPVPPEAAAAEPLWRVLTVGLDPELEAQIRVWLPAEVGYQVHAVQTSYEAGLAVGAHMPACVVIDLAIGRIETRHLAQNLVGPGAPMLVALVGQDFTDELPEAFDCVLVKPITAGQLVGWVQQKGGRHHRSGVSEL